MALSAKQNVFIDDFEAKSSRYDTLSADISPYKTPYGAI